jgi:hypothetical protein
MQFEETQNVKVVWFLKTLLEIDLYYFTSNKSLISRTIKIISRTDNLTHGTFILNRFLTIDLNLIMEIVEFAPIEKFVYREISLTQDTQVAIEFLGNLLSGTDEQTEAVLTRISEPHKFLSECL